MAEAQMLGEDLNEFYKSGHYKCFFIKPKGEQAMSDKDKFSDDKIQAMKFLNTHRGQYIVGQALWLAIQSIEARPEIEREPSNVADMQFLMDNLFPLYAGIEAAKEQLRREDIAERLGLDLPGIKL